MDIKKIAEDIKELKEWLSVFKTEYNIADEAYEVLKAKIDELGNDLEEEVLDSE